MIAPQTIYDIKWSHSALDTADKCLATYRAQYVATPRLRQPETDALRKGNLTHEAIETWIKTGRAFESMGLPGEVLAELQRFGWAFERYTKLMAHGGVIVEGAVAIDGGGQACEYGDRARYWGRGKLDLQVSFVALRTMMVVDWKTGKVWPSYDQASRYGAFVFAAYPDIDKVIVQFAYVTANTLAPAYTFYRHRADYDTAVTAAPNEDAKKLLGYADGLLDKTKLTLHKVLTCYQSGHWPEQKNIGCRWCPIKTCTTRSAR